MDFTVAEQYGGQRMRTQQSSEVRSMQESTPRSRAYSTLLNRFALVALACALTSGCVVSQNPLEHADAGGNQALSSGIFVGHIKLKGALALADGGFATGAFRDVK